MPFVLLVIGAVFLVSGIRGTQSDYTVGGTSYPGLFTLVKGDFSGDANYMYWFASIFLIGCVGYVKQLKPISDAMILLAIVSMFVAKSTNGTSGGFFEKAIAALKTPALAAPDATTANNASVAGGTVTTSPSGATILGNGVQNIGTSIPIGTTGSAAISSGIQNITNFGTSY